MSGYYLLLIIVYSTFSSDNIDNCGDYVERAHYLTSWFSTISRFYESSTTSISKAT